MIYIAFPGTYNIAYYRGDTYDFVINPKNSNGTSFDLSGFSGLFAIATVRGDADAIVGFGDVALSASAATVTCEIPSTLASTLSGSSYVYDIQISNSASTTYTLLTGNIAVTQDVSGTAG